MDTQKKYKKPTQLLKIFFTLSIHFFYSKIKPLSTNEEEKRREFILNYLLLLTIFLSFLSFILNLLAIFTYKENYQELSPIITFSIFVFFLILLALSKKSYIKLASNLLIFTYLLPALYFIIKWGVDLPIGPLFFVLIIIMSSVLLGTRYALFITSLILLLFFITAYLQISGIITYDSYWKQNDTSLADLIIYAIIFFVITTISWLSNREIKKSLKRAVKSESALKIERDNLELRVEEKIKDFKKAQMEKMPQLYRFAEFGRLSSGLFHDIVNPLTSLSLNLSQVKEKNSQEVKNAKSYLNQAIETTKRMESFVGAIRKQIQKQKTNTLFSITKEIIQSIQIFSYLARKKNIRITFKPYKNIKIQGDIIKFNQVISNFISNAIDSFEDNIKIDKNIKIKLWHQHNKVFVEIKDNGSGIKNKHLTKIWDPFFTTKSFDKGIGIGLSSAKDIVEKDFLGEIKLKTKFGTGTKFTISIPTNKINHENKT